MRAFVVGCALLVLVAAGCTAAGAPSDGGSSSPDGPASSPATDASPSGAPSTGAPSPASGSGSGSVSPSAGALSAGIMDPILADVAQRSGMPVDELVVVTATARTWSDAGLGCPVAGMNYIQVPVDGYQVVVEAGTVRYDYRGTGPGRFRLCTAAPG